MPVTVPEILIGAIAVLLLLHVPPGVTSLNDVIRPTQTSGIPEIVAGSGSTTIPISDMQPDPSV